MPGIPKSLGLPQSITFDCEITDVKNGIDWIVKAPLGLVQKTAWRIVKRADVEGTSQQINDTVEDGGEWALVEDVDMEANRFLINTVKNKCEANWRGIQKKFADHVKEIHNASRSSTQRDIAIAP